MIPKHYKLQQEHPNSYQIFDSRDGSSFHVAKNGLDLGMHGELSNIQKMSDGGTSGANPGDPGTDIQYTPEKFQAEAAENSPVYLGDLAANSSQPPPQAGTLPQNPPGQTDQTDPSAIQTIPPTAQPSGTPNGSYLEQERADIQAGAAAEGRAGTQTAAAIKQKLSDMDDMEDPQDIKDSYAQKGVDLEDAIQKGKIDPSRWNNSQTTSQKIGNALGMMFSGLGSASAGQPNYAMDNINKAIDRDIESQKSNQATNMSLYQMNRQNMDSDIQANALTRNQMLTGVKLQAEQFAAQAAGPEAKARAAQLLTNINSQLDVGNHMLAISSGNAANTESSYVAGMNYMQRMNPEYHKDLQAKYLPGIGVSRVPVTENDRQAMTSFNNLGKMIDDAQNFQRTTAGTLGTFPFSKNNAIAESKQNAIMLELNHLHNINRLNDTVWDTYKADVSNPGSFFTQKSLAKLGELGQEIKGHQTTLMSSLGVTPFKKASQDQQAMAWAQMPANQNTPQARAILTHLSAQAPPITGAGVPVGTR